MHRNRRGGGVMHRIPAFPSRVWTPFGAVTIHNFYTAMPPVQCPYSARTVPVQCPRQCPLAKTTVFEIHDQKLDSLKLLFYF